VSAEGVFPGLPELSDAIIQALRGDGRMVRSVWSQDPGDCVGLVVEAVGREGLGTETCVILDDLGVPNGPDAFAGIEQLGKALWRMGARLVLTTRSIESWPAIARSEWALVDETDLSLNLEEASALAGLASPALAVGVIEELHRATGGHVALFCAMAAQARRYGLNTGAGLATGLEAWLERVLSDLGADDEAALRLAAALKSGTDADLRELGSPSASGPLRRIGALLPLVAVKLGATGSVAFRVHDLVEEYLVENGRTVDGGRLAAAIHLLTLGGDHSRACELLAREAQGDATFGWLERWGEEAFAFGHIAGLAKLFKSASVQSVMSSARTLVLWARVCGEVGMYEESLAKARAARLLAEHERDQRVVGGAIAQSLFVLRSMGRQEEAEALAEEITNSTEAYVDDGLLAEALLCIGIGRVTRGDSAGAEPPLRTALGLCAGSAASRSTYRLAQNSLALFPAVVLGDFQSARRELTALVNDSTDSPTRRVMMKGNLAQCLMECGRLERADSVVRAALAEANQFGLDLYTGSYMLVVGVVRFAAGDAARGMQDLRMAAGISTRCNDVAAAAEHRAYLGQMLRALGRLEESLSESEQAFEGFSIQDAYGFRRAAALEVAASLLALGDLAAARSRSEAVLEEGPLANKSHGIRAAMILAECDRQTVGLDSAVDRLRPFADYVRSENANWQAAMYCRTFPSMLGMLALAVGVEPIPSHLLKMIPPESAEGALMSTHSWLAEGVWRALGARLLGDEEFARFLARDGLPVCHVRFFGGLEVSIGGRSVREKDWRKRKARLLFAMLVLRRGQDVPRDQLFEYLFSEMEPERAKNNLYVIWSTMKSVLMGDSAKGAPFPYFEAAGGVCRSVRENIRSDVDDFDTLLAQAREHEAASEPRAALQNYEQLASLYRAELLPGDLYDDWFAELREHYRIAFVNAMLAAGEILMGADDPGNALVYVRRAIQTDSLREDLYQVALRCQIAAGQRSGAIDTYLQCRSKLADDLGLDPSAETRALYDQILAMEDKPRVIPFDPLAD
jgi:DNA-binding SARP family transcriptional activator